MFKTIKQLFGEIYANSIKCTRGLAFQEVQFFNFGVVAGAKRCHICLPDNVRELPHQSRGNSGRHALLEALGSYRLVSRQTQSLVAVG